MDTLLILPNQEESWASVRLVCEKTKEGLGDQVDSLYVDRDKIFKQAKTLLTYKKIICLDHSVETLKALTFAKEMLGDDLSIELFALGMASSLFWPLHKWGLAEKLGQQDRIIVSCERDLPLTKASLPHVKRELRPFDFFPKKKKKESSSDLFYIGRLTFLKNIHGLIHFFKDYRREFPEASLKLIGDWDQNDLPFFSLESKKNYKDYIQGLIQEFNLEDSIDFQGSKSPKEIANFLEEERGKFISLSLQNDENYGLAAGESLSHGNEAILSNWGGHAELKKIYATQVKLLDVDITDEGPAINLSQKVDQTSDNLSDNILHKLTKAIEDLVKQREAFNQLKKGDVLFKDNKDPIYALISMVYAGKEEEKTAPLSTDLLSLFNEDISKNFLN